MSDTEKSQPEQSASRSLSNNPIVAPSGLPDPLMDQLPTVVQPSITTELSSQSTIQRSITAVQPLQFPVSECVPAIPGVAGSFNGNAEHSAQTPSAPVLTTSTPGHETQIEHSRSNSRFMKTIEKQTKFTGDEDEHLNWERTIMRTIRNHEQFEPLSEMTKLGYASFLLDGAALGWLCSKEDEAKLEDLRPFLTLQEFLVAVKTEFGVRNADEKAFHYLKSLKPVHIDVTAYLNVFSPHIYAAEGMSDSLKARFFKEGLHPAITQRMKLKLLSKEDNLNLSKCKEAAHQAFFEHKTEPQGTTDFSSNEQRKRQKIEPSAKTNDGISPKKAYNKDHSCDFCQTKGHLTIDCRKRMAHDRDSTAGRS